MKMVGFPQMGISGGSDDDLGLDAHARRHSARRHRVDGYGDR